MTILHVVPTISNKSAGTTETVLNICEAQANLGHEVELFTLSLDRTHEEHRTNFSIKYLKRKTGLSRLLKLWIGSDDNAC